MRCITVIFLHAQLPRTVVVENDGDTLLFEEVAYAHQGNYLCQATNPGGSVTKQFTISVAGKRQLKLFHG